MMMENKKYIGYILVVIVLGFGIYFINKGDVSPKQTSDNSGDVAPVTTPVTTPAVTASNGGAKAVTPEEASPVNQQVVMKDGMYIVSYGNNGFSPASLEIDRGESVRFVNDSTKAMRVGGTTDIPALQAFNQPKTVGQGGTYEYTFNDPGIYEYANYNNTADKGAVIVK
jgi:plastocyanin